MTLRDVRVLCLVGVAGLPLHAGSVFVSISYYGVPIRYQVEDLCDKVQCPVEPGAVTFRHVQSLPYITPAVRRHCPALPSATLRPCHVQSRPRTNASFPVLCFLSLSVTFVKASTFSIPYSILTL